MIATLQRPRKRVGRIRVRPYYNNQPHHTINLCVFVVVTVNWIR